VAATGGPLAGAGNPRRREQELPRARRVGSFLVWWVLLMGFWTWIDDSIGLAELVVGAAASSLGALLAEAVQYQADSHIRIRFEWVTGVSKLPVRILRDFVIALGALWRRITKGEEPPSGFRTLTVQWGDDTPEGITRRALIVAANSVAPNTFALGIDKETNSMVVHHLVVPEPR
jgi:multisubunit Na+/H+ antiporter MnhE subunit